MLQFGCYSFKAKTVQKEIKYQEKKLKRFQQGISVKKDDKSLLAVQVNVKNAENKKPQLNNTFLLDKGCAPDILCLSETHIGKNLPYFETYKRFYGTHKINVYGGVYMYVKSNFSSEQIKDEKYIFDSNYFEHLWVKLKLDSNSSIVVGAVYRHGPSKQGVKLNKFQEEFFNY